MIVRSTLAGANASAGAPPSPAASSPPSKARLLVTRLGESPWARPAVKVLGAFLALVVLSAIGGSALAGAKMPQEPAPTTMALALPAFDAGATEPKVIALAETIIEVPRADSGATPSQPSSPSSGRATPESPVTLNTATMEDLRRLPGVGPKKAEAILALRTRLGKFRRPEDLLRVKGIGRGTFKKLRPLVRVDEPEKTP